MNSVKKEHNYDFQQIFTCSDSTTALACLKSEQTLTVFDASCVSKDWTTVLLQWKLQKRDVNQIVVGTDGSFWNALKNKDWPTGPTWLKEYSKLPNQPASPKPQMKKLLSESSF